MPENARELAHEVVEEVKHLEHEAEEGETARTPVLVLSGVMIVVTAVVVTVLVLAFIAYYVTK
jgi:hypothetical protein